MTHNPKPDSPGVLAGLDLLDKQAVSTRINRTKRGLESLMARDESFPRPKRWGKGYVWRAADIDAWVKAQFADTEEENAARLKSKGRAT